MRSHVNTVHISRIASLFLVGNPFILLAQSIGLVRPPVRVMVPLVEGCRLSCPANFVLANSPPV